MQVKTKFKQTEVGIVPTDWNAVFLDSVAARGSGHTPDKKRPEYWNGHIRWISLKDSQRLDSLYISETEDKVTDAGIANSSARLHPAGTVVVSRDAGVGKSAIMSCSMAVSQHFMAWSCGAQLDNRFLYYWLQTQKTEFERIANGNTIKTIGLGYFKALKIPLPPLSEQRAISTALSDVDALINSLDRLIAKKRDIKQATMQQLLTGKTRLPGFTERWQEKLVRDIAPMQRGFDLPNSQLRAGKHPVVYSNGIVNFHTEYKVKGPGVVTGRSGTIGKVNYVLDDFWPHNTALWVTSFKGNCPKYIFYFYRWLGLERFGTGSGVPTLNRNDVHEVRVKIPSLAEQEKIAEMLSVIDDELAIIEQRREKTTLLKQGMMQELLTGRIRLV
jgi:type I restriction enzyme S subunit